MKCIHAWTHPAGQLQGIKRKNIKGGDNSVYAPSLKRRLSLERLPGEGTPGWGETQTCWTLTVALPLDSKRTTQTCFYILYCNEVALVKLRQKSFFRLLTLWVKKRQWGACRLTVCQTTRSAHPRRGVGFLAEYSYLKPRSLLCGCERNRKVGPHRDNFAIWPMYRFDVMYRLNESITTCFFWCVFVCVPSSWKFNSLEENK